MTVKQLREELRGKGIKYIWKMKKAALIVALEKLRNRSIVEKFEDILPTESELVTYKDHDNWLEVRKLGIGGSDVSAILGHNKYKSDIGVYLDKTDGSSFKGNRFTYWGHRLEAVVAEEFENKHQEFEVFEYTKTIKLNKSLANVDRIIHSNEKGFGVLECKTTNEFNKSEWLGDTVPQAYYCQVQHYLAVTGLQYAYISCLIGGQDYKEFYIERDQEECEYILNYCEQWWNKHIIKNLIPEADGSEDYDNYLKTKSENLELTEVVELENKKEISEWENIKLEIKALEKRKKQIEQEIFEEVMELGATKGKIGNHKFSIQGGSTRISFDSKKLKADNKELYERYIKESQTKKFLKIS